MKLSMHWLADAMKVPPIREYAAAMTLSGSKVESILSPGEEIKNVVVGKVTQIERHPDSDHLFICQVDAGQEKLLTIVTGAQNVKKDDIVPVALHGSTLPGGVKIRTGKLRGVESQGMLCSLGELGLTLGDVPYAIEDGILILQEQCAIGQDIREVFGLDDTIVDFEITPNRPDCLSVRGLMRESLATFGQKAVLAEPVVRGSGGNIADSLSVEIRDPDLCPRYTARMVKNIKIGPSPSWMRQRLRASGIRPINNIVDITNYVMVEYGQPMHAFDYACLGGGKIVVRRAAEKEEIQTLDGKPRPLKAGMLVIADEERAVGVAGVMGGANSEITENTRVVIFESANFDGPSVRQTAVGLGMRTDASSRFEKGLDPENTIPAVQRACELVELLECGEVVDGLLDVNHTNYAPRVLTLEPRRINDFLGTHDIPREQMVKILTSLDFKVEGDQVTVPSWRGDVEGFADLAEEVARFYGYDKIPSTMISGYAAGGLSEVQQLQRELNALLRDCGWSEAMTFSFISPSFYDQIRLPEDSPLRNSLRILNPLGEDTSIMRTTALPSMLETLSRNHSFRNPQAQLFELAAAYTPRGEELPLETRHIVLGAYGGLDFFGLKGVVEQILELFRVEVKYSSQRENPTYHPGRCADILLDGECVGTFGEIHPLVARSYDLTGRVCAADLNFDRLFALRGPEKQYTPLPRFPATTRDIALVCDRDIPVGTLMEHIRRGGGKLLERVTLFDVYVGEQIAPDKKSVAFSLSLRASDRTLTDEEADKAVKGALEAVNRATGATLRA